MFSHIFENEVAVMTQYRNTAIIAYGILAGRCKASP